MATRDCRFISNRISTNSPSSSIAEEIYEAFIQPVVTANFPDFVVHLFEYDNEPGSISDDFLEKIVDVDLVIVDLSELSPSAYFQVGVRHSSGKPLVFIADEQYVLPLHATDFEFVRYRYDNGFSEDGQAAEDLVNAIQAALNDNLSASGPNHSQRKLSPRQTRAQLAARLSEAAEAIRLLRINSAAETAIELEDIAKELEQIPEDKLVPALQETVDKFLKVLSRFADQLATIRGSRMLISGLISVVIGGAGYSAIAAFGMSLAFWEGKEAFLKAIEIFNKRKK
jgi:hypothetical protein